MSNVYLVNKNNIVLKMTSFTRTNRGFLIGRMLYRPGVKAKNCGCYEKNDVFRSLNICPGPETDFIQNNTHLS